MLATSRCSQPDRFSNRMTSDITGYRWQHSA
ncbi:hypothetical protein BN439_0544 [Erwinia amylovora Ea644]|uniref:Uncharacterized protein n=3 Tax=Erwinia amylovora TaxID=552 RepID=A0A831EKI0_ERWAM|nr:hypothetical protein EaACW_2558 [Erwinia amylovora ACW56400]QJQ53765.1 hypothetical protein EHX00_1058 [Erwinia amylovora]CBA21920.1 hypothetical protein predicted by Glimmer/Critica [Erwinia amylovora CFBP1430]CBX81422.1 hypothetical protein predicted by Glimmer/Critica [Erwinia amylovora ATCC BAA-2158]CCO79401.1 hypothetical protein BN432_2622 [Erwinia amylovora Ea356]CCO83204.1 hypothetical protein BN433_2645 [Erwinia amylovora Ea266]CCO86967.1 hypothetical protein BN434_2596 [Erwinia a